MGHTCAGCKAEMDPDAIFCNECGMAFLGETIVAPIALSRTSSTSCPKCGRKHIDPVRFCSACAYNFQSQTDGVPSDLVNGNHETDKDNHEPYKNASTFSPELIEAAKNRYRDGYRVARAINGYGSVVKAIGFIIGGLIAFGGFIIGGEIADGVGSGPFAGSRSDTAGIGIFVGFVITSIGVIVGAIFWVIGVIYMAQGQKLKAAFDAAVNSSPFLTDLDRANIMSLPIGKSEKKTFGLNDQTRSSLKWEGSDPTKVYFDRGAEVHESADELGIARYCYLLPAIIFVSTGILSVLGFGVPILGFAVLLLPFAMSVFVLFSENYKLNLHARFHAFQAMLLLTTYFVLALATLGLTSYTEQVGPPLQSFFVLILIGLFVAHIILLFFLASRAKLPTLYRLPILGDWAGALALRNRVSASD